MTIEQIAPWTVGCTQLAQRYTVIGLKLHFNGTMYTYITDWCAPHEIDRKEGFMPALVQKGFLMVLGRTWTKSTSPHESDPFLLRGTGGHPVDDVPWEIHEIDDPIAYKAAKQAYVNACQDHLP